MSIGRAIEKIKEWKQSVIDSNEEHRVRDTIEAYDDCLEILKEEAEPPCERCKHWHKFGGKGKKVCCQSKSQSYICKHHPYLKDFFEPKETSETQAH